MKYLETTPEEPLLVIEIDDEGAQAYTCRVDELFGEVYERDDKDMLGWFKWAVPALMDGGTVSATGEIEDEEGDTFQQMMSYSTDHPEELRAQWDALLKQLGIDEADLPEIEDMAGDEDGDEEASDGTAPRFGTT
jgi:hypothetical protein